MGQQRDEFLRDIAITAVEGGITYWAALKRYKWSSAQPASLDHMLKFPQISIAPSEDPDDFKPCDITVRVIQRGVRAIASGVVPVRSDLRAAVLMGDRDNDASDIDADAADVIVQAGLFGEIVFG